VGQSPERPLARVEVDTLFPDTAQIVALTPAACLTVLVRRGLPGLTRTH
jgi:hypothetical protein